MVAVRMIAFLCIFRGNRFPRSLETDPLLNQGMDVIFVEDPLAIQKGQPDIPLSMKEICEKQNIPLKGNAAGNYNDFLNLTGEIDIAPMECGYALSS